MCHPLSAVLAGVLLSAEKLWGGEHASSLSPPTRPPKPMRSASQVPQIPSQRVSRVDDESQKVQRSILPLHMGHLKCNGCHGLYEGLWDQRVMKKWWVEFGLRLNIFLAKRLWTTCCFSFRLGVGSLCCLQTLSISLSFSKVLSFSTPPSRQPNTNPCKNIEYFKSVS